MPCPKCDDVKRKCVICDVFMCSACAASQHADICIECFATHTTDIMLKYADKRIAAVYIDFLDNAMRANTYMSAGAGSVSSLGSDDDDSNVATDTSSSSADAHAGMPAITRASTNTSAHASTYIARTPVARYSNVERLNISLNKLNKLIEAGHATWPHSSAQNKRGRVADEELERKRVIKAITRHSLMPPEGFSKVKDVPQTNPKKIIEVFRHDETGSLYHREFDN